MVKAGYENGYSMGVSVLKGALFVSFASEGKECALLLYEKGSDKPFARFPFPEKNRLGNVRFMTVKGEFPGMEYLFEEDGKPVSDPYGKQFSEGSSPLRAVISADGFSWEGDQNPGIPFKDSIIYRIHAKGFTKHPSSGVKAGKRGTFAGVTEKIPYMKELGITALELMIPTEPGEAYDPEKPNYWGYGPAFHFAPRASYGGAELKALIKALHKAGMEFIAELYFDGSRSPAYCLEAARYWVSEYHADGLHFTGEVPVKLLGEDPYLGRTKLFAESWNGVRPGKTRHLAEYNRGFMEEMRCVLKGDGGQMNHLAERTRKNPKETGVINFMANTDGFTLMDMVSYDKKHNEDNGEKNADGTDYNCSWNCGAEGPTRKKKVLSLRRRQLKNALLLLLLSQGTPLITAGDEFGRTKLGNNNSYCQDNEISWLNWKLLKTNSDLYEFAKYAIAFRKAHPLFHMEKEPSLLDEQSVGLPDVSYHGRKAWCPEFDDSVRQLGIFYCGQYAKKADGKDDDYFYVAYNMHWEPHEFALPNLPRGLKWHLAFDTFEESVNGFYLPGSEPCVTEQKTIQLEARSIKVLIGKKTDDGKKSRRNQAQC